MMTTSDDNKQPRSWIAVWALVWALELAAGFLTPAFAQRRRADPEANPQFQDELAQKQGAGGPIAEDAGGQAGAEPSAEPAPSGGGGEAEAAPEPEPEREARPGRNVRIGAEPSEAAPPPPPSNPLDTRIVVRVKNAPLSTFLDTISAQAKVNFIITEGLENKRVTAFLQNVTVREALQILLEIKGLTYQRIGKSNTYVVSPRAKGIPNRITRIYTLNYIPLMPTVEGAGGGGQQQQPGAPPPAPGGGGGGGEDGGQGGQGQGGAQQGAAPAAGLSNAGVAIVAVLRSVLSGRYGNIAIDPRTNAIIVTDFPEVFPQVEQILAELDRKAPQVMIEAQIVEINSDRANQLGLEWGGTNGELASFNGGSRDTTFPLNLPKNMSNTHFFDPLTSIGSAGSGSSGDSSSSSDSSASDAIAAAAGSASATKLTSIPNVMRPGILDLTQLRVILRALVSRAEARFLGKPKILTINNRSASIRIAREEAVSIQSVIGGGSSGITSAGTQAERFQTGLNLTVTPQVNREGYITMLIEPSFTNVLESRISSQSNRVFDPTTRGASSLVRVKNGQTLVLGGLLESRESKAVRKVPFLGYIPLIGWLFTSTSNQRSNTDLVIFITPTIVND